MKSKWTGRIGKASLAVVACLWLGAWACNAAQWFQIIGNLLPIAGSTLTAFETFQNKGMLPSGDQAAISNYTTSAQTILSDIGTDVKGFQDTGDTTKIVLIQNLLQNLKTQTGDLLTALQVRDPQRRAEIQAFTDAILQDATDLAGLVPAVKRPQGIVAMSNNTHMEIQMRTSLPKARSLQDMFQSRLTNLPK